MRGTIRERLGRQTRPCVFAIALGWAVFAACVFMPAIPLPIMLGAFVAVIGGILALLLLVRCPRCRARLPQIGVAEWWLPAGAAKPTHCPRCQCDLTQSPDGAG